MLEPELNRPLLSLLLQEERQYRAEVKMFDTHMFRVLLTYVTALIAAFGWLASQIIQLAGQMVEQTAARAGATSAPPTLASALSDVFEQLARGPFFYLFTAVPLITALMFLFVARDWASLHERFVLLHSLGDRIAQLLGDDSVLKLDRGFHSKVSVVRARIEASILVVWLVSVLVISGFILVRTVSYIDVWFRGVWWCLCLLGEIVGLVGLVLPARLFSTREYRLENRGKLDSVRDPAR